MTAPESVACKVPHYPYPAVEKFSDSVLSAERCIQSQGLTTECGSKGLTAMSGQTMVQMRPSDASSHMFERSWESRSREVRFMHHGDGTAGTGPKQCPGKCVAEKGYFWNLARIGGSGHVG